MSEMQSPESRTVEEIAGYTVKTPERRVGFDIEKLKRTSETQSTPIEDVVQRRSNTTYHVVSDSQSSLGVLVTVVNLRQAPSWEHTSVTGTAREKNTSADVIADVFISPLAARTALPDANSYDPQEDSHAERREVTAATLFSDERLRKEGIDPNSIEQQTEIPVDAKWFQLATSEL